MWGDANPVSDGVINGSDVYQGLTVALPSHGDHAYTDGGQWRLVGQYDLNDPDQGFPLDGLRQIGVTAEDVAGNVSDPEFLNVFIDTQGPRVTDVEFNELGDAYDVFDPKPSEDGPTPLVIHFRGGVSPLVPAVA